MRTKDLTLLAQDIRKVDSVLHSEKYLYQAANYVASAAKLNAPGDSGMLRNTIGITIVERTGRLEAHIGTNLEYALYVELGTGPKGMADHTGISPEVTPTYRTTSWWIHESQVDPAAPTKYHWFSIDTEQGKFYQVTGQPAQPFLYPALKDNEKVIGDILAAGWKQAIRKAL